MEPHRNPSPPESPTWSRDSPAWSCDSVPSADLQQQLNKSEAHVSDSPSSLVNYDDRIGDTVFSKAWVLSILVKAVQAVKDLQSKIVINRPGSDVDRSESRDDEEERTLSKKCSDELGEGDAHMEASECDQSNASTSEVEKVFRESTVDGGQQRLEKQREDSCVSQATDSERLTNSREDEQLLARTKTELVSPVLCGDGRTGARGGQESCVEEGEGERRGMEEAESFGKLKEIDENLENDLCRLWDASMNMEVAQFIHKQHGVELLVGVASQSTSPRLTEICIGILGNMACSEAVCLEGLTCNSDTIQMLIQFIESADTRILYETTRLIATCLSHEKVAALWVKELQQSNVVYPAIVFILQGSTNSELLQSTASLLDRLLDGSDVLLKEWATAEMVEAVCEAMEQVRIPCVEAACTLLMSLQLLSTQDEGVAAIVDCETKVISLLSSFLSELDHLEGRCSPVMATVSLFIALKENSTTDHIKQLLTDDNFVQMIQKLSHQAKELSQLSNTDSSLYSKLYTLTLQLL